MANSLPFRIGHGYDIHRVVSGRPLVLGGVTIPWDRGLDGHSDADCLTHALADAILGALGLPDIGHYFPNTDQSIKDINSQVILKKAADECSANGYKILNVDCTLIAEKPKIAPHIDAMKAALAATLELCPSQIGLKATTNEKLGAIGAEEGICAHAVVILTLNSQQS